MGSAENKNLFLHPSRSPDARKTNRCGAPCAVRASNPGTWFEEPGGGGFNAARNLARLGFQVTMISPRGGDP
ncbi:PfkB family carbohydrate kinase, partial [Rhizobium leguminosarum]|uniref:PfkB family carbohydrate kinase n=1 Tax=Rhizobium leguminosarum TaxID=384 RepID=UPI003F98D403